MRYLLTMLVAMVLLTGLPSFTSPAAASSDGLTLTKAQKLQIVKLRQLKWKYQGAVNFWRHKGRWVRHLRHEKCWNIRWRSQRTICFRARRSFRAHQKSLVYVTGRLEYLTADLGDVSAWRCIHSREGDWEDGGWTYIGGLQMDRDFVHAYGQDMIRKYGEPRFRRSGPNGWINAWTPREQVMVAERAHDAGRGYYPWPRTARRCGLI